MLYSWITLFLWGLILASLYYTYGGEFFRDVHMFRVGVDIALLTYLMHLVFAVGVVSLYIFY